MTDGSTESKNRRLEYTTQLDQEEVKRELDRLVQEKLDRLSENVDASRFEEELQEKAHQLEADKAAHYRSKGENGRASRTGGASQDPSESDDHVKVYAAASAALKRLGSYRPVGEGFIHRTWRLIRSLKKARLALAGEAWCTEEVRSSRYRAVFDDCWGPLVDSWDEMWNCAWNFVTRAGTDLWDLLLIVADLLIAAAYYAGSFFYYIWDLLWDVRYWFDQHKRNFLAAFATVVVTAVVSVVLIQSATAYEYTYHGRVMGVVKNPEDVYSTIDVLGDKLSKAAGVAVSLDVERDMTFRKVMGLTSNVQSDEDILNTITYMKDLQVEAYAVMLDGEESVVLESEGVAKSILSEIQNEYAGERKDTEYTSINYDQQIVIQPVYCLLGDIWNRSDAKRYLQGDPSISMPAHITIRTTETAMYTEPVPFSIEYVNDSSMYTGVEELRSEGEDGLEQVVATIERINGEEVSRTIVSTTEIREPVPEIRAQGTRPIPVAQGTGQFIYPLISYTLSSPFGMRWGTLHTGVDLAAPMGSRIYASDGGTVEFAGWHGSYGYLIIINHGGLYETYYAHCSAMLVSAGDEVVQGQNIGLVGSTGFSTGPHCHFEIRYNGTPTDPLGYL
ncbi:MAG: peptidoglycan DD-metalloendopeptidase family protein [Clostridia bacterium]|nr:peptidoglycan DD-metalloendopeptidase family protein [Clostridia bacterium]